MLIFLKKILGLKMGKSLYRHSIDVIYEWLNHKEVKFLPVNWPERGMLVKAIVSPGGTWHGVQVFKL